MKLRGGLPPAYSNCVNSLKSVKRVKICMQAYTHHAKWLSPGFTFTLCKIKMPRYNTTILKKWSKKSQSPTLYSTKMNASCSFPIKSNNFFLLLAKGTTKGSALLITFLCYPSHFLLNFGKKIFWKDLDNNSPNIDNRCRLYSKFK